MHYSLKAVVSLLAISLSGCNSRLQADLFGSSYRTSSPSIPKNQMRSSELSSRQLSQLFYLAPGQSRQAMNTWSQGKYPKWVDPQTEVYEISDNPGTCLQLNYDSAARFQSKKFVRC